MRFPHLIRDPSQYLNPDIICDPDCHPLKDGKKYDFTLSKDKRTCIVRALGKFRKILLAPDTPFNAVLVEIVLYFITDKVKTR